MTGSAEASDAQPMAGRRARRRHALRLRMELREGESVRPLELFFDLVFVLAFTQCTALMVAQPDWTGIGRGMLALAVIWWAWVCYSWLTSVIEPEEGSVRLIIFGAMAGLLVVGLSVPEAFGDRAVTFAIAYGVVRLGHIALFVMASRDDPSLRRSVLSLVCDHRRCGRRARRRLVRRWRNPNGTVGGGRRGRLGRGARRR